MFNIRTLPSYSRKGFQNSKIKVLLEKFTYRHISYADDKKNYQLPDLIHDHVDLDVI